METIFERCAALDVHKAQVTGCVRLPESGGGRRQELAEFATTVSGLLGLRDWLEAHGVSQVAMEATGVYWKPVWAVLEDGFTLTLCNARHVKQVPGRKTDVSDAAWLAQLLEAGLLRASFVPPKPIRELRTLTRYRKTQIQERQREANRLHKALEDTGMPQLKDALAGRFSPHHALVIGAILATSTFSTSRSSDSRKRSSRRLPLSPRRLACSARSPASSAAAPR